MTRRARVAGALLADNEDLNQTRVAFLVTPGFAYAAVQRGIWRAGGVAVPLAVSHPPAELEYVIRDSGASIVVADPACDAVSRRLPAPRGVRFVPTADAHAGRPAACACRHLGAPPSRDDHLHERHDRPAEGRR